jgi:N,N'-diacetyllegionaminate synthase
MEDIDIADRKVGGRNPCFIIAEAGVNHNGDLAIAKKLIDVAKNAGCDAVKFQTFKAENIVTKNASMAQYQADNTQKKESQQEMLKKLELREKDFLELKKHSDTMGIVFLSTPHSSTEDIDLVANLCPAIKIASADLTNMPFLKYAAKKDKPIILGTGMGTISEVGAAVRAIRKHNRELVLLHCTSSYPTMPHDVNVRAMKTLKETFKTPTGYSDHTLGILASLVAVSCGASVIEKHFTLDRRMEGPDHKASIEPQELRELVSQIRLVEDMLGSAEKRPTKQEEETAKAGRKSIVALVEISRGETIKKSMLGVKRPGTGIQPDMIKRLVGKKSKRDILKDEVIKWDMIIT